jgi:galactitol-specific phosphotransferase system IIB component
MKILYIQKQDLDATVKKIMEEHKKGNDVTVVNLKENKNYGQIVDLIFSSDKVISW